MLKMIETRDCLRLTLGNAERAELADALREGYQRAESLVSEWLHEAFEFIRPEEIGALTDAPILCDCDGLDYPDTGDREIRDDAAIYWFPDYMIRDPWADLAWRGRVEFVKAA